MPAAPSPRIAPGRRGAIRLARLERKMRRIIPGDGEKRILALFFDKLERLRDDDLRRLPLDEFALTVAAPQRIHIKVIRH